MNDWLIELLPASGWLWFYLVSAGSATLALLYILEQIIIYGSGHFSHPVVALYRVALIIIIVTLFADILERLAAMKPASPTQTLLVFGLAMLSFLIVVTHKRQHEFGA